jgi:ELWxxDGT repeat protein
MPQQMVGISLCQQNMNVMKKILSLALLTMVATLSNASTTGTFSLIEINPAHGTEQFVWSDSSKHVYGAGELSNMTELNGNLYFIAQDTFGNEELWMSNGTPEGTSLVKDINPDGSAQMGNIITVGNKLLFMASDNSNWDFDLFSSDGTPQGTTKIADLNQNWNDGLSAQRAARFGDKFLFCTNTDLISTDGTAGGTKSLLSITNYSPAQGYCEVNGKAYFILSNNFGKPQLWMTDGTTQGTQMALNLGDSASIISVEKLLAFNNKLYMVASISGQGSDLFTFDGNVNGHFARIELVPGSNAYPQNVTVANNELLFVASNMTGTNLYHITSGNATPQLVASAAAINIYGSLSVCNNAVYFTSDVQNQIHWVSLSDLSHQVLTLPNHTMPGYFSWSDNILVGTGGKIFFAAYDTATNKQVFMESNGTPEGTFVVMPAGANTEHPFNILLSCGAVDQFDFKVWGNKIVVPANFTNAGRELWIYEPQGLVNGIETVKIKNDVQLFPNPTSSQLNFKISNANYCETNVTVTNMNGEVMLKKTVVGETSSVDVSALAAGNYCISFSSLQNATTVKKFVVLK